MQVCVCRAWSTRALQHSKTPQHPALCQHNLLPWQCWWIQYWVTWTTPYQLCEGGISCKYYWWPRYEMWLDMKRSCFITIHDLQFSTGYPLYYFIHYETCLLDICILRIILQDANKIRAKWQVGQVAKFGIPFHSGHLQ
jgi:hypothetical protein